MTSASRAYPTVSSLLLLCAISACAAEWQWSAPLGDGRAFLWIPPQAKRVRAVMLGQNNMIEQGIFEHPLLRRELARLGIAEIFIAPPFDTFQNADHNDAANATLDGVLTSLARNSGYTELPFAPVIPLGHSALASYPWNFAAWNPERTLAVLSIHGDAPQTGLTGNGRTNAVWGKRNIDGIPGLMVIGEYEWWEDRLAPALKFRRDHPKAPVALLAEPGNGHFNYSAELIRFLALFIRKAAEQRLPADAPWDRAPALKPIDPTKGWLVQRWRLDEKRTVPPARYDRYAGDPKEAFWAFDKEAAWVTHNYLAGQTGKRPQLLTFVQEGKPVPQTESHQQVNLEFVPLEDGVTFQLSANFMERVEPTARNLARWTHLPPGSPLGHATGGGPILISRISGPVALINSHTFRVQFDRISSTTDRRNSDLWLLASQPGDEKYKSIVQQALLRLPLFTDGSAQHITFPEIPDQQISAKSLRLGAVSDSGRKVYYYVRDGPAEIAGDTLQFTRLPVRAKLPVQVTVVAWQLGTASPPGFKTAEPVERKFQLTRSP